MAPNRSNSRNDWTMDRNLHLRVEAGWWLRYLGGTVAFVTLGVTWLLTGFTKSVPYWSFVWFAFGAMSIAGWIRSWQARRARRGSAV